MDDAGLKTECEIFLVSEASKSNSFLQRSPLAEFVELLEVVDTCCLEEMMPFCTAEIIVKWRVGRCSHVSVEDPTAGT